MATIDFPIRRLPWSAARPDAEGTSRAYLPATGIVLLAAVWLIDHDISRIGQWDATIGHTAEQAAKIHGTEWESGELGRRLAFPLAAAWGALLAVWAPRRLGANSWSHFAALPVAFALLCFASVLWTDEPGATIKKLITFGCMLTVATGVGLTVRPRQLCLIVTLITSSLAFVAVAADVASGVFQPWVGDYRLSGTLHPNYLGAYLATACVGSFCLWNYAGRAPWWAANSLLMLGLTVLTKSRMALLALLITLVIVGISRWSRAGMVAAIAYVLTAAGSLLLLAGVSNRAMQRDVFEIVLLNRVDEVGSLTGRTPLWRELVPRVAERPLLGHGFAGFWTTDRYAEVAAEIGWPASHAHSAYLGAALELGLVGIVLWAAIAGLATWTAARRLRRGSDPGYGFLLGMGTFVLLLSATETMFFLVNGLGLLLTPGIVMLALGDDEEELP